MERALYDAVSRDSSELKGDQMRKNAHIAMLMGMVLVMGLAAPASADLLTFSGELSDNDAPIDVLDAAINYGFDSTTNVLTIEVTNATQAPGRLHAFGSVLQRVR